MGGWGEMAEKMINPLSENIYKRIYDRKEDIRGGHYFVIKQR